MLLDKKIRVHNCALVVGELIAGTTVLSIDTSTTQPNGRRAALVEMYLQSFGVLVIPNDIKYRQVIIPFNNLRKIELEQIND